MRCRVLGVEKVFNKHIENQRWWPDTYLLTLMAQIAGQRCSQECAVECKVILFKRLGIVPSDSSAGLSLQNQINLLPHLLAMAAQCLANGGVFGNCGQSFLKVGWPIVEDGFLYQSKVVAIIQRGFAPQGSG